MKKIVGILSIVICLGILSFDFFVDIFNKNTFSETTITNDSILECPEDIPKGYYDVEVIDDCVSVGLVFLNQGEIYHNYYVDRNSLLFIDHGKGTIKINQSKREFQDDQCFQINHIGNYIIGEDIKEGEYQITLLSQQGNQVIAFVYDENENGISHYTFKKQKDKVKMKLENDQKLFIERRVDDGKNLSPILLEFKRVKQ